MCCDARKLETWNRSNVRQESFFVISLHTVMLFRTYAAVIYLLVIKNSYLATLAAVRLSAGNREDEIIIKSRLQAGTIFEETVLKESLSAPLPSHTPSMSMQRFVSQDVLL